MLFDLWDKENILHNFMDLYNVSGIQMCNILKEIHLSGNQDSVSVFCKETGFKLDEATDFENIEFVGKIVSSTIDDFECLKEKGLTTVDVLLETDSPISRHLKKYNIEIKPSKREWFYNGNKYYIYPKNTDCVHCFYGDDICRFEDKRYKEMYCRYLEAISSLETTLYHDNAEIEMFLLAQKETMLKYSTVIKYPEIFYTIQALIKTLFGVTLPIGDDWEKEKQSSYIVTTNVKYTDMSYVNGYISVTNEGDAAEKLSEYENFCCNVYDFPEEASKCFWDNIWLIQICLDIICSFGNANQQIYAGLKHDISVPYDKLSIELI